MAAYYNEIDAYCVDWLKNLIREGLIPDGDVDPRSIRDVEPRDLAPYTQVHLFAGLGGWAYAARLAGWPDGRPVWTGSCPCQPFSVAGQGKGTADERHLWPEFHRLIRECRPAIVFGEQVAGKAGLAWLDGVLADLEGSGYACGAAVVPACGVGAPHRRERLWFVADADGAGWGARERDDQAARHRAPPAAAGGAGPLADPDQPGARDRDGERGGEQRGAGGDQAVGAVGDAEELGSSAGTGIAGRDERADQPERPSARSRAVGDTGSAGLPPPERTAFQGAGRREEGRATGEPSCSPWDDALWLTGADGKSRRVGPGLRLLAHGIPARVAKLRALGNAIVPQVAAAFIAAYREARP